MREDTPAEKLMDRILDRLDEIFGCFHEDNVLIILLISSIGLTLLALLVIFWRARFVMTGIEMEE